MYFNGKCLTCGESKISNEWNGMIFRGPVCPNCGPKGELIGELK